MNKFSITAIRFCGSCDKVELASSNSLWSLGSHFPAHASIACKAVAVHEVSSKAPETRTREGFEGATGIQGLDEQIDSSPVAAQATVV